MRIFCYLQPMVCNNFFSKLMSALCKRQDIIKICISFRRFERNDIETNGRMDVYADRQTDKLTARRKRVCYYNTSNKKIFIKKVFNIGSEQGYALNE